MKTNLILTLLGVLFFWCGCKKEPVADLPNPEPCTQSPTAQFQIQTDATCKAPCEVRFVNQSENGIEFLWDFGDGTPPLEATSPTHQFRLPGTYEVMLTALRSGCPDDSFTLSVEVDTMRFMETIDFNAGSCTAVELPDGGYLLAGSSGYKLGRLTAGGKLAWSTQFSADFSQNHHTVTPMPDGLYALSGSGTTSTGSGRPYVALFDENGTEQGHFAFPFAQPGIIAETQYTNDGGVLSAGTMGPADSSIFFIAKMSGQGELVREHLFEDQHPIVAMSLRRTSDGGFIACGVAVERSIGTINPIYILLVKLNAQGDVLWEKQIAEGTGWAGGAVEQTADGGFLLVGGTGNLIDYPRTAIIAKLNPDGSIANFEELNPYPPYTVYRDVRPTNDGGHILVGTAHFNDFVAPQGILLTKMDAGGQEEWTRKLQISGEYMYARSVIQTADGGYFVTGSQNEHYPGAQTGFSQSRSFLFKTDGNGYAE